MNTPNPPCFTLVLPFGTKNRHTHTSTPPSKTPSGSHQMTRKTATEILVEGILRRNGDEEVKQIKGFWRVFCGICFT